MFWKFFILAFVWLVAMVTTAGNSFAGGCGGRVVHRNFAHHNAVVQAAQVGVFVPQQFVVTQFAVPVGVPVARASYVSYASAGLGGAVGYEASVSSTVAAPQPSPVAPVMPPVPANPAPAPTATPATPAPTPAAPATPPPPAPPKQAQQPQQAQQSQQAQQTQPSALLQNACAKCHGATDPKGNFSVAAGKLTCEQRLSAISRLLSDDPAARMPKGQQLDPQTLGRLIQELSAE